MKQVALKMDHATPAGCIQSTPRTAADTIMPCSSVSSSEKNCAQVQNGLPFTKEIRAVYTESTVRVYQAYNKVIADACVGAQKFVSPWRVERMTWIKPSAVWMGYRCGWTHKDANQSCVLAIDLHRSGFEWLLKNAVLASKQQKNKHDIVVQWDPERALGGDHHNAMTHPIPQQRSLQMGLRGLATQRYADEFVVKITDVSDIFSEIGHCLERGNLRRAQELLPEEKVYPVRNDLPILLPHTP